MSPRRVTGLRRLLVPMTLAASLTALPVAAQTPLPMPTSPERLPMHADAPGAEWIPSPNFNPRRASAPPVDVVVLHSTCMATNTVDEVVRWFQTPGSEVSSHYVVGKDGRIVQMVAEGMRAWHAGACDWRGRRDLNSCSIGIEMVHRDQDAQDNWPEAQVQAVAGLLADIRTRHAVPDDHVVFHSEIAVPPGRKHDPRDFNRDRLLILADEDAAAHGQPPSAVRGSDAPPLPHS